MAPISVSLLFAVPTLSAPHGARYGLHDTTANPSLKRKLMTD